MYKGVHIALSGAVLRSYELDNVANNLANATTSGYKRTSFSSRLYKILEDRDIKPDNVLYPDAKNMTYFGNYKIDTSQGNIKSTGNPLDFAIEGEGFFVVQRQGTQYYTRNGSFTIDKDGFLVTQNGFRVMTDNDMPIQINNRTSLNVTPDGSVYDNGILIAKLKLVNLENISHLGDSLYTGLPKNNFSGTVLTGAIEMSNVNSIREMIGIITALRQFDAANRLISNFDEMSRRSLEIVR